jgi:hypothetical protein
MTAVIGETFDAPDAGRMMGESAAGTLAGLQIAHNRLEARMRACLTPDDVLNIGHDVLEFAAREDEAFRVLLPLIDPAARAELAAEHEQIEEDLDLLGSLVQQSPHSSDVSALAYSIARRMAQHVERDGRLLARAVKMSVGTGS